MRRDSVGWSMYGAVVDQKYEPRVATAIARLSPEATREVIKGQRIVINLGEGVASNGTFLVTDVSEPDMHGAVTLTLDEAL